MDMSMLAAEYHFCPQCGHSLQNTEVAGRMRENCPSCSFVHWGEFSLGVGGIVWRENKVLLVQRAYNPGKGVWTIPGGYVDQDERLEDAIAREVQEETGILSEPVSVVALRDRPGAKHDAYIVFLMRDLGGTLRGEPAEVSDLGFFTVEECRRLNIASLSLSVIEASSSLNQGLFLKSGVQLIGDLAALYSVK